MGEEDPEIRLAVAGRRRLDGPRPPARQSGAASLQEMVVGMTIPGDGSCMGTGPVIFRRAAPDDLETIVALLADAPLGRGRENPGPRLDACYREASAAIERGPDQ